MSEHSLGEPADRLPGLTAGAPPGARVRPGLGTRLVAHSRRALDLGLRAIARGAIEFYNSNSLTYAAAIAYYSLLSLFPFVLLILSFLSRLRVGFNDAPVLEVIFKRALPREFDFVTNGIVELTTTPLKLSLVGTPVLIWAAMGVFGAITTAVNYAWGVEKPHSFFKHKLIAFLMLICAGLLMMGTLMIMGAVKVMQAGWLADVITRLPEYSRLAGFVYRNLPTASFMVIVTLIYYFVPNARVRLRDVWIGAVLAGILWRLAFEGFSWYVRDLSRFSVHGSVAAVVVFLLWVYLSTVIFLYGVEVSAAYARLRKNLPQEAPAAHMRED